MKDSGEAYYLANEINFDGVERKPWMQDPDVYGIAVIRNIVNKIENTAAITFLRPLKPLLETDLHLEED